MLVMTLIILSLFALACTASVPSPSDPDWTLVRRSSSTAAFHPATDNSLGTESYGTPVAETASGVFSLLYDTAVPGWDQALFITGDRKQWMVMAKTEMVKTGGPATFTMLSSYLTPGASSTASMYNRGSGNPEDPWWSPEDHFNSITDANLLYGEASYTGAAHLASLQFGGLNVFVRNSLIVATATE
jgi:hypothetical protein